MAKQPQARSQRAMQTREFDERPKQWMPPSLLPEPDKQPGFTYRWVRISTLNEADSRNLSTRLREGWEPVTVEEQPQFKMLANPRSRLEGCIEVGGLVLCKAPVELMEQRDRYYQGRAGQQMAAVDNNLMSQNDARMPLFKEQRTTHSFGQGM